MFALLPKDYQKGVLKHMPEDNPGSYTDLKCMIDAFREWIPQQLMWINHELLMAGYNIGSGAAPTPAKTSGGGRGGHSATKHVNNTFSSGVIFSVSVITLSFPPFLLRAFYKPGAPFSPFKLQIHS